MTLPEEESDTCPWLSLQALLSQPMPPTAPEAAPGRAHLPGWEDGWPN